MRAIACDARSGVVARSLRYARSAIAGGRAHVAGKDGGPPRKITAWGWHRRNDVQGDDGAAIHEARGTRIGYTGDTLVWLDRDELLAVARQRAKERGEPLQVDGRELADRMDSRKLLTEVDTYPDGRIKSKTTRLMVAGTHMSGFLEITADTVRREGEAGSDDAEPAATDSGADGEHG